MRPEQRAGQPPTATALQRRARSGGLRFVNSRLVDYRRPSPLDPLRRTGRRRPPLAANDNQPTVLRRITRLGTGAVVVCIAGVLALMMAE